MKTKTLVLAAIMFLGLGAAAFAQATFTVGSIPVTQVINTGLTEQTGDITFNVTGATTASGTITLNYGVPITVTAASITVGVINPAPPPAILIVPGLAVLSVNNSAGQVVISVPAGLTVGTPVTVRGVRVAVGGTTLTSLNTSISATNNAITAGQTNVIVINSIAAGIAGTATSKSGAATGIINATTGVVTTAPVITVREGYLNAWADPAQQTNPSLRFTLSQCPPAGVSYTFPATATTNVPATVFTHVDATGAVVAPAAISSTNCVTQVYYKQTTAGDPATQEILSITPIAVAVSGTATLPLPSTAITYTVTLAPIGTALTSTGTVDPAAPIPRYLASEVGPAGFLNIVGTTTTLLLPFGQTVPSAGYDTGIAIANTTTDPGATPTGIPAPVKQSGKITFYFFPQAVGGTVPASFSYTTGASSPGGGLDASGNVATGSTYVVLLSQLLAAAGASADFSGNIYAVTGFTNAHGLFVISNFSTFSQGSLMPVIFNNRATGAAAVFGESLGF